MRSKRAVTPKSKKLVYSSDLKLQIRISKTRRREIFDVGSEVRVKTVFTKSKYARVKPQGSLWWHDFQYFEEHISAAIQIALEMLVLETYVADFLEGRHWSPD